MKRRWQCEVRFIRPVEMNNNVWYPLRTHWTRWGAKRYVKSFTDFAYNRFGTMYLWKVSKL